MISLSLLAGRIVHVEIPEDRFSLYRAKIIQMKSTVPFLYNALFGGTYKWTITVNKPCYKGRVPTGKYE